MALTSTQLIAIRDAIIANPTWNSYPLTLDGYYDLARVLSQEANPSFWVWSTDVDVNLLRSAIVWANLTPTDAPDGSAAWTNRSLQCQGKQFNLQMIIPFTGTLNATDVNLRNGLQDALQGVRSGVGGVSQDAGWTAVRNTLARKANYVEKILADITSGSGSTRATAASLVYEGTLSPTDVELARKM